MITNISWTEYIIAIVLLLVAYYLFIGVKYFSDDIKAILSGKQQLRFGKAPLEDIGESDFTSSQEDLHPKTFEEAGNELSDIEHLIERLSAVIADGMGRKLIPQEFRQYLSMVLKEYPAVKYSPLRASINEFIVTECKKYGTLRLTESDVELLWNEVV